MTTELVNPKTGEIAEVGHTTETIVGKVQKFMDAKEKKILFSGKRYAEFEDWQYVAAFFELRAKTLDPQFVEINNTKGFRAKAVVVDKRGNEVGSAEAFCMLDEPNWKNKPLFQLSSMAQTRAAAKALSNLFRPIMRLAGIEGTPSEEMTGQEVSKVQLPKEIESPAKKPLTDAEVASGYGHGPVDMHGPVPIIEFGSPPTTKELNEKVISEKQRKLLYAKYKSKGVHDDVVKAKMILDFKKAHSKDLTNSELTKLLNWVDTLTIPK